MISCVHWLKTYFCIAEAGYQSPSVYAAAAESTTNLVLSFKRLHLSKMSTKLLILELTRVPVGEFTFMHLAGAFIQSDLVHSSYTGAGHIIRISSKRWFISLIPFKKWNLYNVYILSTQTDIFQVFISFNFDDNWQLMKTPNSVSQKIRILLKTNYKERIFRNLGQLKSMNMKSMSIYSTQYLVGAPFAWITAAMRRGMESISLWHCSGVMRAQVALIVAFSSSALLGLAYRIFLFTIPHRFSMGLWSGEFAGQLRTGIPWSLNQVLVALALCRCQVLLENEICISIKLVSSRKHEVL